MQQARTAGIKAPAVFVVGRVVGLRDTLQWFERRPLLGKRIVVTRARAQASELTKRLEDLGAECLEFPTIRIVPPESWDPLDAAITALRQYEWLIFTSVNAVDAFFERLKVKGLDTRSLGHLQTAAIGPATARRMLSHGLHSDILPQTYQAESVVEAFAGQPLAGKQVLLPRAREARTVLPDELRRMGATVNEVTAYRTVLPAEDSHALLGRLEEGGIDMITFTSSSTARNLNELLSGESMERLKPAAIACIGDITADTARTLGFNIDVVADEFTIEGLCAAIVKYYQPK